MFIANQNITVANVTNAVLPGLQLLEVTNLVAEVAIFYILFPVMPLSLKILDIISFTSSIVLLTLQKFISTHDCRNRKYNRLICVATLFLEEEIVVPISLDAFFSGALVPFGNTFREISEILILAFGLSVGGTVAVAKIVTVINDALFLEEIFEGDYNALFDFFKEEGAPQPVFLLSNNFWRFCTRICRPLFEGSEDAALIP